MLKARPRPAFSPPHRRKRHIVALREGDPFLLFLLFCFLLFWDGGAAQYLSRYSPYTNIRVTALPFTHEVYIEK